MKLLLFYTLFSFHTNYGGFCEGFKDGWKAGYCYQQYGCVAPYPPYCPVREYGEKDIYVDGYNKGFILGLYSSR
jgi:hypothetical protein